MVRTVLCSFAGAAIGYLMGYAGVLIVAGSEPHSDTAAITLFFGGFLAGCGAIAGAVTGGVADLLQYLKRRDEVVRDRDAVNETESSL